MKRVQIWISWGSGFKMVKPGAIFKQWENSLVSSQEDEEAEELKNGN